MLVLTYFILLQICEHMIRLTNGDNPKDTVPPGIRHTLLKIWIQAKQLLQVQIGKNLGAEDDVRIIGII